MTKEIYCEEMIIDGILCRNTNPDVPEYFEYSKEELTVMLTEARRALKSAQAALINAVKGNSPSPSPVIPPLRAINTPESEALQRKLREIAEQAARQQDRDRDRDIFRRDWYQPLPYRFDQDILTRPMITLTNISDLNAVTVGNGLIQNRADT